jgi:hypothetical protein
VPYSSSSSSETAVTSERDLLLLLDRFFREAVDHPVAINFRKEADLDFQYYEGEQWTETEKGVLRQRNQAPIVENEIKPIIDRLLGQFRRQRTTVKFTGRNSPMDDAFSHGISDLTKHVDQRNEWEFEECDLFNDGLICGRGVGEACITVNELGEPEISVKAEDTFTIFPDPYSRRYDWNLDARYICRAKWMALDDAQLRWPHKKAELAAIGDYPSSYGMASMDPQSLRTLHAIYFDDEKRLIRPVEVWYKKPQKQSLYIKSGQTKDVTGEEKHYDPDYVVTRTKEQMCAGVFSSGVLIEHQESPYTHNYFPFFPYFAYRKKNGEPMGFVRNLRHPQDEINHRRSRALYLLNNRQTIFEDGAIANKDQWAEENARSDGMLQVELGKFDKVLRVENNDIGQANMQMMQESKQSMQRISGISSESMGMPSEVRSGVGIARKQAMTDLVVAPVMDNVRRTRRLKLRLVFELIKQFYSGPMMFQVTDDPNITRTVVLSATHFTTLKEQVYDLVVEDATDYLTVRQEQLDTIMTTLPQIMQAGGPAFASIMMSMTDIRGKENLAKQLEAMAQPPPPPPKYNVSIDWKELNPVEKAAFATKFGMPDLAKVEVMGAGSQAQHVTKGQEDLQKTKMKSVTALQIAREKHGLTAAQERAQHLHDASMLIAEKQHEAAMTGADQAHEAALQDQQHQHELTLQENEPAPASGA